VAGACEAAGAFPAFVVFRADSGTETMLTPTPPLGTTTGRLLGAPAPAPAPAAGVAEA
jgi:hypothetical protein